MSPEQQDHRLAIVGAGVMGTNITALAVGHGVPVVLVDLSEDALARARTTIAQKLRHAQLMGALPADRPRGELVTTVSAGDVADATTVIEAVVAYQRRHAGRGHQAAGGPGPAGAGRARLTRLRYQPAAALADQQRRDARAGGCGLRRCD